MSAMEKMLSDMVMKAIPEDVRALLTVENATKIKETVEQAFQFFVSSQTEMLQILRRLDDRNNSSGSGGNASLPAPDGDADS